MRLQPEGRADSFRPALGAFEARDVRVGPDRSAADDPAACRG